MGHTEFLLAKIAVGFVIFIVAYLIGAACKNGNDTNKEDEE